MEKDKINFSKHLAVIVSVALIFLLGIIFGYFLTNKNLKEFKRTQEELKNEFLNMELENMLISEFPCNIPVEEIGSKRSELGKRLDSLEKSLGKNSEDLIALKQEYSSLSIKQWVFINQLEKKCKRNITMILFFYSNKDNTEESENQGLILDYFYEKHRDNVMIFALDFDLDNVGIKILKNVFNVTKTPTLIVNNIKVEGLTSNEMLERLSRLSIAE